MEQRRKARKIRWHIHLFWLVGHSKIINLLAWKSTSETWSGGGYVNTRQTEITVANEAAATKYQEAYYWYTQLTWEPNLSPEGRDENLAEAKKYEDIMAALEIKA